MPSYVVAEQLRFDRMLQNRIGSFCRSCVVMQERVVVICIEVPKVEVARFVL